MIDSAIEILNISKKYSGKQVLKDVSFKVLKNRIHGFLGENGAGKSTTMKAIMGIIHIDSGFINIDQAVQIGYLPEIPPLYENLTVREFLKFTQDIYTQSSVALIEKSNNYKRALEKIGLETVENRLIKNLSKGYKQRVGMASALVFNPEILIFDEPTVGLDPNSITQIRELILELKKDHTILLSTHQLHEANFMCDDLTIIKDGEIISSGTIEDVTHKFFSSKILKIEVDSITDKLLEYIESNIKYNDISQENNETSEILTLEISDNEDYRPLMSKAIIEFGLTLYSMQEIKPDLEDIFTKATKGE